MTTRTPGKLTTEPHTLAGDVWLSIEGRGIVAEPVKLYKMRHPTADDHEHWAEMEANAAHLALCWNTHEDLVAALELLDEQIQHNQYCSAVVSDGLCSCEQAEAFATLDAALAAAKGVQDA